LDRLGAGTVVGMERVAGQAVAGNWLTLVNGYVLHSAHALLVVNKRYILGLLETLGEEDERLGLGAYIE
jgi:hypothetical protein